MHTPDDRQLELLKWRLLLHRLDEVTDFSLHARLIHEADEAARLARQSPFPLLVFPCLFEEKAAGATEQARRQAHLYWHSLRVTEPALAV